MAPEAAVCCGAAGVCEAGQAYAPPARVVANRAIVPGGGRATPKSAVATAVFMAATIRRGMLTTMATRMTVAIAGHDAVAHTHASLSLSVSLYIYI